MNWINRLLLIICGFLTSCQTASQSYKQVYIDLAYQEIFSFAKEVKQSDGLHLSCYGGGFFDGIDNLSLTFMSPESPTVEEARLQFYDISHWFLNCINQNKALRPYLVDYPFTIDNLDLFIIYSQQVPGVVCGVTMGEGFKYLKRPNFIYYYGYENGTLYRIYKESYEEGIKLVKNYQNKNPEYFLNPRSLSYPLKYLDKKQWFDEMQRIEAISYGDNFVKRPNKEDDLRKSN